ncbi:phage tail domain-containing protein [Ligilactobacillus equi]|uniref:Phage tail component, N-terminal domain protein n=1 Tax=Ligilactobacillus equi DPC 6820 TaxID=1392007 RepID=V7I0W4_9LACO|nr:phage tail domain-containing protein [Ligilactobacillus equi]ETA75098.1 phage tail component, N-terminal domain protein [Ligilactobacillus equi DPC 6820]
MSSVFITRSEGIVYDLDELGYKVKKFDFPSTNYSYSMQQEGTFGNKIVNTSAGELTLTLTLKVVATDNYDFELKRFELNRIFSSYDYFWISSVRFPYLQWKVKASPFTMEQVDNAPYTDVSISLVCDEGFAESVGTTADDDFTFSAGKWGLANYLPNGEGLKYIFVNQNKFKVYNASVIPLRADERPVDIIFNGNVKNKLTIKNNTTNQSVSYNRSLSKDKTLTIHGLVPIEDNQQMYYASDHGFIDFTVGWNELEVVGASDFTIKFRTKFYY